MCGGVVGPNYLTFDLWLSHLCVTGGATVTEPNLDFIPGELIL